METVAFVSCVKTKHSASAPAREIFLGSALFRLSFAYARSLKPDTILVLSTEYGLLDLDESIRSYDRSPNLMSAEEWEQWALRVMSRLPHFADASKDKFIFATGRKYSAPLVPFLRHYELPLEGLTQRRRLQFLKAHTSER